ncbi:type IV secretion system protein virB1 [Neisseria dentiae]|uniref:Type IV secretion system protein virB1 n=1 Tax=Neisseria dentiae TaxID=194197 RepID=A0A1X3D1W7_9NEIS|nr:lytic transglycosylase domain-containing protein [Neisseria dentiae]OSI13919.1 type IV secretion system protein virB1 [Neisseria dentiae]QMT44359.1 lytic transglycosylase domain-containing protein [Neisseria dentiae]STZ50046.1 type IV secretion system lytic transglycosylase VirB1 [Neisseria dentiae]
MIDCGNLHVPPTVMQHVVRVESSFNPYAIGVVKGRLSRQPKNLPEALATVKMLEEAGYNFSVGIAQVNRYNLKKYGLSSYSKAFDVCSNLRAGSKILQECYISAGRNWGKAFSCYYSGNFVTGFRHGYVQKVFNSMRKYGGSQAITVSPDTVSVAKVTRAAKMEADTTPRSKTISRPRVAVATSSAISRQPVSDVKAQSEAGRELRDRAFVF